MKNLFYTIIAILAITSCTGQSGNSDNQLQQQRDSLQAIIDGKDHELNEIMGIMNEVQEGISRINEAEGRITVANAGPETASAREVIRDNMQYIQTTMQQNRELISNLQEKLRHSNINAEKLQATIQSLQKQVEVQNQQIQELMATLAERDIQIQQQGEEITSLNDNVASLTEQKQQQASTIAQQDKDLNAAWFVFGTKSELREQNILRDGVVLKSEDFNVDYFTRIDIRKTREIKLYSKNAKLLTTHPEGSYSLTLDSNKQYQIIITNPTKFWSVTRYLVIQVK